MSGFVSFVGSGPGDPELLTVKAVNRISKADAVLFDDLSAGPILAHAKPSADLVGVGTLSYITLSYIEMLERTTEHDILRWPFELKI